MKKQDFNKMLDLVDEKYVDEANPKKFSFWDKIKRPKIISYIATGLCAALLITNIATIIPLINQNNGGIKMVKKINSDEFQNEVLNSKGIALVDLFADWCMPCQMIAPIIEEISNEKADVNFFKINVDESSEVAVKYGISSIPTLLIFKDGELVNKAVGAYPKEKIVELLEI